MTISGIQVPIREGEGSPLLQEEQETWLGQRPREASTRDVGTLPDIRTSGDVSKSPWKDDRHDPAARGACNHGRMELMTKFRKEPNMQGLLEKILEEIPQPEAGDTAGQALREKVIRAFAAHSAQPESANTTPFVGDSAEKSAPEPATDPVDTSATGAESALTDSARPRTWKQCPDLTSFLQGATRENPITDTDLQKAITDQTGYSHPLTAVQRRIWRMAEQGKVQVYTLDGSGNLIPYPAGRRTYKPHVVWIGADAAACQSTACAPGRPDQANPEPLGTTLRVEGEDQLFEVAPDVFPKTGGESRGVESDGGPGTLSSLPATDCPAPPATMKVTANEPPIAPEGLLRWMQQHGVKKVMVQVEY